LDRVRPRLVLLSLAALAGAAGAVGTGEKLPILAANWLAPEGRVTALSTRPRDCARPPAKTEERALFEVGRTAFCAPLLLGGQAARAGLSCESCHSNGRRNSAFHFPGLSGEPGTADVTSSIMSSHRGDDVFDPKPIPDLARPVKVSRDPASGALERFVHGLIVEEFDGPEPPQLVQRGLAAYLRSMDAASCAVDAREPITLTSLIDDSRRAIASAVFAWSAGDRPAARLMVAAARSRLGLINERFDGPALAGDRQRLVAADLELLAIEQAMDRNQGDISARLAAWQAGVPGWAAPLRRNEPRSLFNPSNLTHLLAGNAVGSK
jgi:hypothetical protein